MSKFCVDFKMRREFKFPLEYERDPQTNKSEVEILEEISNKKGYTVSRTAREYILNGMAKDAHISFNEPKLDQFVGKVNPEDYVPMEPTLADMLPIHEDFIPKANLSLEELRRRANACLSLSKLYDREYELEKERQFQEARDKRHDKDLKNEELVIGIEE